MEKIFIFLSVVVVVAILFISPIIAYTTDAEIITTVKSKERIVTDSSSKYLIFTESEVLENTDSIWYWKWDSSDFYNSIEVGQEYTFRVYGFRVPFLSWYKNIIEIKE